MRINTPAEYASALTAGTPVSIPDSAHMYGRILRGRNNAEFKHLASDGRKFVMLMGADGLSLLPGRATRGMLDIIALTPYYVKRRIREGHHFKLAVFRERHNVPLATWQNVLPILSQAYPELANDIARHQQWLRATPFTEVERQAGYKPGEFDIIDENGPKDSRYMTLERYRESDKGPLALRALLFHEYNFGSLYKGDGYTYTLEGKRGLKEYYAPNRPLSALGSLVLINLDLPISELP